MTLVSLLNLSSVSLQVVFELCDTELLLLQLMTGDLLLVLELFQHLQTLRLVHRVDPVVLSRQRFIKITLNIQSPILSILWSTSRDNRV